MVKKIRDGSWKKKTKAIEKDMVKKIGLFDRMGDKCAACSTHFDKTDVEMVRDWHVTVRGDVVRIYCTECWKRAKETIEDFKTRVKKRSNNGQF